MRLPVCTLGDGTRVGANLLSIAAFSVAFPLAQQLLPGAAAILFTTMGIAWEFAWPLIYLER